jgi:hypothetical protein
MQHVRLVCHASDHTTCIWLPGSGWIVLPSNCLAIVVCSSSLQCRSPVLQALSQVLDHQKKCTAPPCRMIDHDWCCSLNFNCNLDVQDSTIMFIQYCTDDPSHLRILYLTARVDQRTGHDSVIGSKLRHHLPGHHHHTHA